MATVQEITLLIEQLSEADRSMLLSRLTARDNQRKAEEAKRKMGGPKRSIMEFAGLGAEMWREIDVDAYLEDCRHG